MELIMNSPATIRLIRQERRELTVPHNWLHHLLS